MDHNSIYSKRYGFFLFAIVFSEDEPDATNEIEITVRHLKIKKTFISVCVK